MLLQTNSYVVPKEKRADHARLMRRFRQIMNRIGANDFEVYEQAGPNWGAGNQAQPTNRFVQIMRFRDRKHQLAVQSAERSDPGAQQIIAEFCDLVNFPYQQERGLFVVGFYNSVLPVAPQRARGGAEDAPAEEAENTGQPDMDLAGAAATGAAVGMYAAEESAEGFPRAADQADDLADEPFESDSPLASESLAADPIGDEPEAEAASEESISEEEPLGASEELLAESTESPAEEDAGEAPLPVNFEAEGDLEDDTPLSESLQFGDDESLLADSLELPGEAPLLPQDQQGGYAGDADILASEIDLTNELAPSGEQVANEEGGYAEPAAETEGAAETGAAVEGELWDELPTETSPTNNELLTPAAESESEWSSEELSDFSEALPGELPPETLGENSGENSGETLGETLGEPLSETANEPIAETTGEVVGEIVGEEVIPATGELGQLGERDLSDDDLSHLPLEGEYIAEADSQDPEASEANFDLGEDLTLDLASRLNADPAAPENGHPTGPGHPEHSNAHQSDNTNHDR